MIKRQCMGDDGPCDAATLPVLSTNADFSDLREIKKQQLLIAGLMQEWGLLRSSRVGLLAPGLASGPPAADRGGCPGYGCLRSDQGCFDVKDCDQEAHFLHDCNSSKACFLYTYSRYLFGEKRTMNAW